MQSSRETDNYDIYREILLVRCVEEYRVAQIGGVPTQETTVVLSIPSPLQEGNSEEMRLVFKRESEINEIATFVSKLAILKDQMARGGELGTLAAKEFEALTSGNSKYQRDAPYIDGLVNKVLVAGKIPKDLGRIEGQY